MLRLLTFLILVINTSYALEKGSDYSYFSEKNVNIKSIQSEFKMLASNVFYISKYNNIYDLRYDDVLDTIRNVEFLCAKNIEVGGEPKDAVNFPLRDPQLIVLNCEKWNSSLTEKQKKILVVHELLPILGFEDFDYAKSSLILRVHENYKLSKVFFLKSPLKDLNHDLFMALWECNVEKFDVAVDSGADIFNESKRDSWTLLNHAASKGCFEIAEKLLRYNLDIKKEKNQLSLFMELALDLNRKFKNFEDKKKFFKSFVKYYPDVINDTVDVRGSLYFNSEVDEFGISDLCYFKSNALHFWASGIRFQGSMNELSIKNYEFFKSLGVSTAQKNICGELPGQRK